MSPLERFRPLLREHYGPGPHRGTGTPQTVHGGGRLARRARAWAAMAKRQPGGVAAAYRPGATEAAIGRRREWGAGKAPEFRGIDTRDLMSERRALRDEVLYSGNRGIDTGVIERLAGRLDREIRARGYLGGGPEKRGAGYNELPKLLGRSKAERAQGAMVRRQKLAEIDVDLRARTGGPSLGGIADRSILQGVRDLMASERRAGWWVKHAHTNTDALVELVYRREQLGYRRETGALGRFVGR